MSNNQISTAGVSSGGLTVKAPEYETCMFLIGQLLGQSLWTESSDCEDLECAGDVLSWPEAFQSA